MRVVIALVAVAFLGLPAFAHDLGVDCKADGDNAMVEVYFDDDTDAAGAKIRVLAGSAVLAEGTADERGRWSFPKPKGPFTIEVDAGAGHRARQRFNLSGDQPPAKTDSDAREEFTRFRWQGLASGLAIIAVVGFIAWIGLKRRGVDKPHP